MLVLHISEFVLLVVINAPSMVECLLLYHEVHGSIPGLNSRAQLSSISFVRSTGSH